MKTVVYLAVPFLLVGACTSSDGDTTETKEAAAVEKPAVPAVVGAWKAVPNISGLMADVPATAKPNGIGGAAGFHSDDKTFSIVVRETSAEQAAKTMDAIKEETEEFAFKRWISSAATADGFAISYEGITMDMEGNESPQFSAMVRRKIGDKTYDCTGNVSAEASLGNVVKSCSTIRAD